MDTKFHMNVLWLWLGVTIVLSSGSDLVCTGTDWPQFRGVHRDGKSAETGLLDTWPTDGPQLEWTATDCGTGYSSVSVADGKLFTLGDIGDSQFALALNTEDGRLIWKQRIGKANSGSYSGSRSTPTFCDGLLFCLSSDGELHCLESSNGASRWQHDLVAEYGANIMQAMDKIDWRFAESPLVDGELVVVTPGANDAAMVAFDRTSGKEAWRTAIPELGANGRDGAGYASAVVSEAGGVRQYVQMIGRGLISVDATTGKFLWGYNRVANDVANIASPVVDGDRLFASTGYQTGAALVQVTQNAENGLAVDEVYFLNSRTFQNHHGGYVLHDGFVYGGHGHKMGLPVCIRLSDGKVMWGPVRNDGQASAAVSFADGHLYFRYQNGLVVLIEATPDEYREKGSFMIPDIRAESWSYPVISDGCLYLKEQGRVLCYDISASG